MAKKEPYRAPARSAAIPEPYPLRWIRVTEKRGLNDIDREMLAFQEGRELPDDSLRGRARRALARIGGRSET